MCNATGLWMECFCIIDISDNVAKYILWPVSFFHSTLWVKKTTLYSYSYLYQMLIKQFTHNVVRIPRPRKVIHVAFMRLWTLSCICQYYDDFVGVCIYIYIWRLGLVWILPKARRGVAAREYSKVLLSLLWQAASFYASTHPVCGFRGILFWSCLCVHVYVSAWVEAFSDRLAIDFYSLLTKGRSCMKVQGAFLTFSVSCAWW